MNYNNEILNRIAELGSSEHSNSLGLDNLTLGYTMPIKTNKYVRNARIYLTGRNLMTITSYSGIDPELQSTGFNTGVDGRGFYPRTKSFTVGLNVGF